MTMMVVAVNTAPEGQTGPENDWAHIPHVFIFRTMIFQFFFGGMGYDILFGRPDVDSPSWRTFVPVTTLSDPSMRNGEPCSLMSPLSR